MPMATSPEAGDRAPAFNLSDQAGDKVRLSSFKGRKVLVYFYPKADTPGCTKQACSIRDDWAGLQAKGIQVLGVSEDKADAQKAFQDKYKLPFTLIADHDGTVAKAFGVEMVPVMNITKRQSFLIKDGKVAWNMLKATTETHAKDVLTAYESLK